MPLQTKGDSVDCTSGILPCGIGPGGEFLLQALPSAPSNYLNFEKLNSNRDYLTPTADRPTVDGRKRQLPNETNVST
jgi:hypothetical protein